MMRTRIAVLLALVISATIVHGFVTTLSHLSVAPADWYHRVFYEVFQALWKLYSRAGGSIEGLGRWLTWLVFVAAPSIGYAAYWLTTESRSRRNLAKGLVAAFLCAVAEPLLRLVTYPLVHLPGWVVNDLIRRNDLPFQMYRSDLALSLAQVALTVLLMVWLTQDRPTTSMSQPGKATA